MGGGGRAALRVRRVGRGVRRSRPRARGGARADGRGRRRGRRRPGRGGGDGAGRGGPRQRGDGEAGVVAIFTQRMIAGEPVTIFGDGAKTRDYVYVGDVVEAAMRAAAGPSGVVANVGWGREVSDRELFGAVAAATGY